VKIVKNSSETGTLSLENVEAATAAKPSIGFDFTIQFDYESVSL
jgi:hypothetical protein